VHHKFPCSHILFCKIIILFRLNEKEVLAAEVEGEDTDQYLNTDGKLWIGELTHERGIPSSELSSLINRVSSIIYFHS